MLETSTRPALICRFYATAMPWSSRHPPAFKGMAREPTSAPRALSSCEIANGLPAPRRAGRDLRRCGRDSLSMRFGAGYPAPFDRPRVSIDRSLRSLIGIVGGRCQGAIPTVIAKMTLPFLYRYVMLLAEAGFAIIPSSLVESIGERSSEGPSMDARIVGPFRAIRIRFSIKNWNRWAKFAIITGLCEGFVRHSIRLFDFPYPDFVFQSISLFSTKKESTTFDSLPHRGRPSTREAFPMRRDQDASLRSGIHGSPQPKRSGSVDDRAL